MVEPFKNAPCPCGSGKKHKRCCGNVIRFPDNQRVDGDGFQSVSEMADEAKTYLSGKAFASIDDVNRDLAQFYQQKNRRPLTPFLGLSSNQMFGILHTPFSLKNEIFHFEYPGDLTLKEVPFVQQALFFLQKLKELGEIRATQKGNLPQFLVVELYHAFFSQDRYAHLPHKEDDLREAARLKHVLNLAGLIKKRANKFSLTQKGDHILRDKNHTSLFTQLFLTFINSWNWAYGDRYEDIALIQSSAIFNFYLLHKKAQDWILDKDLGSDYLRAFPDLIHQVHKLFWTPQEEIINAFCWRFLHRTCLTWGLLLMREEGKLLDRKVYYKVSPFFKQCFKF